MVYEIENSISSGVSEVASEGFFDTDDRPPWDTWLWNLPWEGRPGDPTDLLSQGAAATRRAREPWNRSQYRTMHLLVVGFVKGHLEIAPGSGAIRCWHSVIRRGRPWRYRVAADRTGGIRYRSRSRSLLEPDRERRNAIR